MNDAECRATEDAGVFARAAATYGRNGSHFGERLVERAQLAPGASVLDVAAGRGAVTFPAAKRVGPTGRVIGIDMLPGLMQPARSRSPQRIAS